MRLLTSAYPRPIYLGQRVTVVHRLTRSDWVSGTVTGYAHGTFTVLIDTVLDNTAGDADGNEIDVFYEDML